MSGTITHTPPPTRQKSWSIVLTAILVGLLLRVAAITQKQTISHDESISYLAAAANQGVYETVKRDQAYPYGTWVTASEWKSFWQVREPLAFAQISYDLADSDIHPPLFFWLLHLWTLMFGVHAWTGSTLNLLLFVISALAVFKLAHLLLKNEAEAAFVTTVWALSPALVDITLTARQYELFGLTATLFMLALLCCIDTTKETRWSNWLALLLATTAGALTHFHFAIVAAGAFLIFGWPLYRSEPSRLIKIVLAVTAGYALFLILHPHFFASLQTLAFRQDEVAELYWTGVDFLRRIYATAFTYTRFWAYGTILQVLVFCIFTSFIIWGLLALGRNRQALLAKISQANLAGIKGIYFFFWMATITILLYLALFSPINAMTPRHISPIWPFAAFMPVLLLRFAPRAQQWGQRALIIMVLASSVAMIYQQYFQQKPEMAMAQFDRVVIDTIHDGLLPRIVRQIPDDTLVFAADQYYLLENPEAWLPYLDGQSGYVSEIAYETTLAGQERIKELVAQSLQVDVAKVPGSFEAGTLFAWEISAP